MIMFFHIWRAYLGRVLLPCLVPCCHAHDSTNPPPQKKLYSCRRRRRRRRRRCCCCRDVKRLREAADRLLERLAEARAGEAMAQEELEMRVHHLGRQAAGRHARCVVV